MIDPKEWDIFGNTEGPKTVGFWTFKNGEFDSAHVKPDSDGWYHVALKRRAIYQRSDMIFAFLFGVAAGIAISTGLLIIFDTVF